MHSTVGTTLVLIALYVAGRIAGYGAALPLLGVVLVAATGFRYWMSFLHFATLLTVLPVLVAWLVSRADHNTPLTARETAGLGLGLALTFLGLRLELMIYAVALVLLGFLALAFVGGHGRPRGRWIVSGTTAVALALAASAWQLAFLVTSTLESQRGALGISPGRLLDADLARWALASIALQPLLLLTVLNIAVAVVCRRAWPSSSPLGAKGLAAVLAVEAGGGWALARLGGSFAAFLAPTLASADLRGGVDVATSPAGLASVVLAAIAVRRAGPAVTLPRALAVAAALGAGFLVSSYSERTWVVNTVVHPYFVPLPLTGLLALGSVGLWLRGRTWVVATLAAYHAVGEIGALPLYESLGVPWFPPRAALVELPFQVMLGLEAARTVTGLVAGRPERMRAAPLPHAPAISGLVGFAWLGVVAILLHLALLPSEIAEDLRGFPFGSPARDVALPNGSLEHWAAGDDGRLAPTGCEYHLAAGAALTRVAEAAAGQVAAALLPSRRANSWLRCDVADVAPLRGRYVRLSAAVRSESSYANAVQLDAQDSSGVITFERSDDRPSRSVASGGWERRAVVTRVHPEATRLFLTINATFAADAAVLVDDLRLQVADGGPPRQRVYAADFPFARIPVGAAPEANTAWVRDAFTAAERLRRDAVVDSWHRRAVSDDVFLLSPGEQYYRFLPAYSRTLNTAPLYASEIPAALTRIFRDLPDGRVELLPRPAHPDMAPILRAYKQAQLASAGLADQIPYPAQVAILPHLRGRPVGRALLAEEGDKTPRAFLTARLAHFPGDGTAEYTYLSRRLAAGATLMDEVTTSDPTFPGQLAPPPGHRTDESPGKLAFVRDEPEHVVLAVDAERDAYLVLLDLWSHGWQAAVDGRPAPVYPAYGAARFVAVPSGQHVVEFRYRVPGLIVASGISLLAWVALAALLGWRARRS